MAYDLINTISNIFTSIGTVSATAVALWLGYKDSKPTLKVSANIGLTSENDGSFLWFSCINTGKQSIYVKGFAFKPNRFKKSFRLLTSEYERKDLIGESRFPYLVGYSDRFDQAFDLELLKKEWFLKLFCNKKWLAKLQLKFLLKIVVLTNLREFSGRCEKSLIEEILKYKFSK